MKPKVFVTLTGGLEESENKICCNNTITLIENMMHQHNDTEILFLFQRKQCIG